MDYFEEINKIIKCKFDKSDVDPVGSLLEFWRGHDCPLLYKLNLNDNPFAFTKEMIYFDKKMATKIYSVYIFGAYFYDTNPEILYYKFKGFLGKKEKEAQDRNNHQPESQQSKNPLDENIPKPDENQNGYVKNENQIDKYPQNGNQQNDYENCAYIQYGYYQSDQSDQNENQTEEYAQNENQQNSYGNCDCMQYGYYQNSSDQNENQTVEYPQNENQQNNYGCVQYGYYQNSNDQKEFQPNGFQSHEQFGYQFSEISLNNYQLHGYQQNKNQIWDNPQKKPQSNDNQQYEYQQCTTMVIQQDYYHPDDNKQFYDYTEYYKKKPFVEY